jgi:hypothetical protein
MKNKLVQYQGGGYDGCMWEWNFAYYDKDGVFHDVFSSGSRGCKTDAEVKEYLKDAHINSRLSNVYVYDMGKEQEVAEFTTETNEGLVLGVAKVLHKLGVDILAKCDDCGKKHLAYTMIPEKPREAGGVMKYTSMVCEDCHSSNSCFHCGEYYGKDYKFDEEGYCEYCAEREAEKEAKAGA